MNVSTNVGSYFLNLIRKHFPPHHKFSENFQQKQYESQLELYTKHEIKNQYN